MKRSVLLLGAALALGACADPLRPLPARPSLDLTPAQSLMSTYVAMGTSNSMGVASAGIYADAQRSSWPAQLARRAGVEFSVPYIQDPGCGPPLQPPLILDVALVAGFAAMGQDLVSAVMTVCMPLRDGITLPTNHLAISGAKARDALNSTPENRTGREAELYSRVLGPGQTQVTAMLAKKPTFVSVELAANEVLPASTGRISAMTPLADWVSVYDQILAAVQTTGAKGVLVGLPNDARNFPSVRRAREFFNEWPYLLSLGISVSLNCYFSSNYVFIPGYVLTLLQKTPTTATCADVPGAVDYVLTSSDMTAINKRMADMNAYIQGKAGAMGFAYFALSALYDLPKGSLNMYNVLFSSTPFGPNISLDGVHPFAAGQTILANAAVQAINAKYGLGIP
jgi:lysophospholipase L1-like esterase